MSPARADIRNDFREVSLPPMDEDVPTPHARRQLTRRQLLVRALGAVAGATFLGGIGSYGYATRVEPQWIRVRHRAMPVTNLPPPLIGKRAVQVSDLHCGPRVSREYLVDAMRRVNALAPDFVFLTGDLVTGWNRKAMADLPVVLGALAPTPLGRFAVLGNHDYGAGWSQREAGDAVAAAAAAAGIRVLRNEVAESAGLQIAGIDDHWSPCGDIAKTMAAVDPARASLVLCHNPDAADAPGWSGYRGWVLCGHTHGGQCKPPFLPPPMLPVKNRRYCRGVVRADAGQQLHINVGLGHLLKARFNVRPEITVFEFRST